LREAAIKDDLERHTVDLTQLAADRRAPPYAGFSRWCNRLCAMRQTITHHDPQSWRKTNDIAVGGHRPAIAALMSYVPTSQILFGSDFPYRPLGETADTLPADRLL
jgi:hypothetical protein